MADWAAVFACLVLAGLTVFQAALIAGAPLGRFAWGGGHTVLPRGLRIGSVISITLYALFGLALLERAGVTDWLERDGWLSAVVWGLAGYFLLGVFMNAISRSRPERLTMTPVALALCLLSVIVALS